MVIINQKVNRILYIIWYRDRGLLQDSTERKHQNRNRKGGKKESWHTNDDFDRIHHTLCSGVHL